MNLSETYETTRDRAVSAARRLKEIVAERATIVRERAETLRQDAAEIDFDFEKLAEPIVRAGKKAAASLSMGDSSSDDAAEATSDDAAEATSDDAAAETAEADAKPMTKAALYAIATELKISGRSKMTRAQLAAAIAAAQN